MSAALQPRMTATEFLAWTLTLDDDTKYEHLDGAPVAMAPERADHGAMKFRIARRLADEIDRKGLSCEVQVDSIGVRVGPFTMFIPDVLVRCGASPLDPGLREINDPMILVEVLSSSTQAIDLSRKIIGYFALPSLRHDLIVSIADRSVVHHRRRDDGAIESRTRGQDPLTLDPPGLVLDGLLASEVT